MAYCSYSSVCLQCGHSKAKSGAAVVKNITEKHSLIIKIQEDWDGRGGE